METATAILNCRDVLAFDGTRVHRLAALNHGHLAATPVPLECGRQPIARREPEQLTTAHERHIRKTKDRPLYYIVVVG